MNYFMKILRQTLKFLILGAVFAFLFLGSKLLDNDKKHHKFTELIKPNEAKADVVGGGGGRACAGGSGTGSASGGSSAASCGC